MRVLALGLALLAACVDPVCQHLQNATTTNASACGAMAPTTAALAQCDQGVGQCSSKEKSELDAFATCLSQIQGCGQTSSDGNPGDSPVAQCATKVANISSQCGTAISLAAPDAGS